MKKTPLKLKLLLRFKSQGKIRNLLFFPFVTLLFFLSESCFILLFVFLCSACYLLLKTSCS